MKTLKDNYFLDLCYPRRDRDSQIELRDRLLEDAQTLTSESLGWEIDDYGNLYICIGKISTVVFTSHLDNVDYSPVNYNTVDISEDGIVSVNEKSESTCLGADDAAGLFIMMTMIANGVNGMYCFFLDEEIGCKGSSWAARNEPKMFEGINLMVSFDRKGYSSIITHQMGENTMSIECATELAARLNQFDTDYSKQHPFVLDDTGSYTDSNSFVGIIPNCTNISVGYFNQHTKEETQDLEFLQQISGVYSQVDWEGLPVGKLQTIDYGNWPSLYSSGYWGEEDSLSSLEELTSELLDLAMSEPNVADDMYQDLLAIFYKYDINDPFYVGDTRYAG